MRRCDRAIATNPFLAAKMAASAGHVRSQVIPNFLHDVQQAVSTELYEAKRHSGFRSDGTITIGYFSGSPTHNRDFAVAAPAVARLMDQVPKNQVTCRRPPRPPRPVGGITEPVSEGQFPASSSIRCRTR